MELGAHGGGGVGMLEEDDPATHEASSRGAARSDFQVQQRQQYERQWRMACDPLREQESIAIMKQMDEAAVRLIGEAIQGARSGSSPAGASSSDASSSKMERFPAASTTLKVPPAISLSRDFQSSGWVGCNSPLSHGSIDRKWYLRIS